MPRRPRGSETVTTAPRRPGPREWGIVAEPLDGILAADEPRPAPFGEAASVVGDIADREEAIFEDVADELRRVGDRLAESRIAPIADCRSAPLRVGIRSRGSGRGTTEEPSFGVRLRSAYRDSS